VKLHNRLKMIVPGGESIHTDPEGHQDPFSWTINHVMTQGCPFKTVHKLHSKIKNKPED